jgi:hypothetical protein
VERAAHERAGAKVRSYTIISLKSSYLPSTKLPPFLYTLVLASLDTPGGAPADPCSGRPRAGAKVRSYPISLSLFLSPSFFGWRYEVERALLLLRSRRGGGVKWSAPCCAFVKFRVSCSEARAGVLTLVFRVL